MKVTKKDFKITWFSGTGAGGQHRNKHQNCCRIKHIPTGIITTGQKSRSRITNKRDAFNVMVLKLIQYYRPETTSNKPTEVIRTYSEKRNEVLDHRTGLRLRYKDVVIKGDLSAMIEQSFVS